MRAYIYQRHNVFDTTPSGVLRRIRRFMAEAQVCLLSFRFKEAQDQLRNAQDLADELARELEPKGLEPK